VRQIGTTGNISVYQKQSSVYKNVIPSHSEGRSRSSKRGAGMRWTWCAHLTKARIAYGKSVWSRRRSAGVNAPGRRSISQGATEAKELFSGESAP
jgi:hypothetical protein